MVFFFNDTATTEIYTLSLHDALPILEWKGVDREKYQALCEDLGFGRLASLPHKWSDGGS